MEKWKQCASFFYCYSFSLFTRDNLSPKIAKLFSIVDRGIIIQLGSIILEYSLAVWTASIDYFWHFNHDRCYEREWDRERKKKRAEEKDKEALIGHVVIQDIRSVRYVRYRKRPLREGFFWRWWGRDAPRSSVSSKPNKQCLHANIDDQRAPLWHCINRHPNGQVRENEASLRVWWNGTEFTPPTSPLTHTHTDWNM